MSDRFNRQLSNDEEEEYSLHEPEQKLQDSVSRLSAPSSEEEKQQNRLRTPSPEDEEQRRLSFVDHLLMTAPLVLPSPQFAERVIEAIKRRRDESYNRYSALGVMLGLGTAMTTVISIAAIVLLVIANIIVNWTAVYQNLLIGIGKATSELNSLSTSWNSNMPDSPLLIALSVLSIPLFFVWMWVMRRLDITEERA